MRPSRRGSADVRSKIANGAPLPRLGEEAKQKGRTKSFRPFFNALISSTDNSRNGLLKRPRQSDQTSFSAAHVA